MLRKARYAFGFCDRTGFRYRKQDLVVEEDTGLVVGKDMEDERHPQDYPHEYLPVDPDPQMLSNPRPDPANAESRKMFSWNPVGVGGLEMSGKCGRTDHRNGRVTIS